MIAYVKPCGVIKNISVLLVFGFFTSSVFAENANITLCESQEDIYFSCPVPGGKIVSVCAFNNINPSSGYVQYRYGTPEKIELFYPQTKMPPEGRFYVVDASEGSVNKAIIKFYNGRYTYLVSQAFVSFLTVLKDGKVVLRKYCDSGRYSFVSRVALKGIEALPKSAEDFK
jgi:hypothetical protein